MMMITEYINEEELVELGDDKQRELLEEYRRGNKKAEKELIDSLFRTLLKLSNTFSRKYRVESEVYFQKSFEYVYEALETYKFDKGRKVRTHVYDYIEKRFLDNSLSGIKGDGDELKDGAIEGVGRKYIRTKEIREYEESFFEDFGYYPSIAEISDALGYRESTVNGDLRVDEFIDVGSEIVLSEVGGNRLTDFLEVYVDEEEREVFDIVNDKLRLGELVKGFKKDELTIVEDMLDKTQNDGTYINTSMGKEIGLSESLVYKKRRDMKMNLIKSKSVLYKNKKEEILGLMNRKERKVIESYLAGNFVQHTNIAKMVLADVKDVKKLINYFDYEMDLFVKGSNREIMYDVLNG